ncbi:hypothetical protein HMPREF0183_0370 [Brevibacterium mcbrellneri ATCC 49030]|uniref:ATP synthase protein I n=1 Tax=Brevibacterium mcbrellneri ATCC 49030 TaxID=585530 RepID=D4YKB0_9MICO|nr:hypothetical protein [Brevibacterium mcbrellneri]EFG48402.1 hypothetical protein HMPREF0183_0370 [Brevibacterium mcbrellneri ATCC 49030]
MKSTPIRNLMLRIIVWGLIASVVLAAVAGVIGYVAVGMPGLYSALIGAAVSFVFFSITALVLLLTADMDPTVMAAGVLGGFLIKIAGFLGVIALLGDKGFYDRLTLFLTLVVGAVVSLSIDVVAVRKARIPYTHASEGKNQDKL